MAKAREIPGLSTELAYGEVAARVLATRTEELIDNAAGVLDVGDIERVHDMRVATRRLRAAIEVFWPCFPAELRKLALAEVKDLADALGERRDRDVAIKVLDEFAETMPQPDRPGVRSLVAELADEQMEANRELAPYVERDRLARLEESLNGLVAAARESAAVETAEVEPTVGVPPRGFE
jgi:CHAD domain-containing protein